MKKILIVVLLIAIVFGVKILYDKYINSKFRLERVLKGISLEKINNKDDIENNNLNQEENNQINDWKLLLVNYENKLPEDFNVKLSNIDSFRQFDSRAINQLNQMLKDMRSDGIQNVWVQSSYRSIEYQRNLFNDKLKKYIDEGKSKKEAERLTLQTINKPGTSEHNLGLAIDFNYVDYSFDKTKGFKWLQENAKDYGFILRYKKEKEDITKVDYEPWHWRYVGAEHAKKMNELDMCLEEYVEYLKR